MHPEQIMRTERVLSYSPEVVYGAFESGSTLASWWGPNGFTNSFEQFEFRTGGAWVFTMHSADGKHYANKCRFLALEPAKRVVIRHDCEPFFTLTVQLAREAHGTRLTWEQAFDDLGTARAVAAICIPANEQNLDRLTHALSRSSGGR